MPAETPSKTSRPIKKPYNITAAMIPSAKTAQVANGPSAAGAPPFPNDSADSVPPKSEMMSVSEPKAAGAATGKRSKQSKSVGDGLKAGTWSAEDDWQLFLELHPKAAPNWPAISHKIQRTPRASHQTGNKSLRLTAVLQTSLRADDEEAGGDHQGWHGGSLRETCPSPAVAVILPIQDALRFIKQTKFPMFTT